MGNTTAKMIHEVAISVAGRYKSEKPGKLLTDTKQLKEKYQQIKGTGKPMNNIEYSEICKAIRRRMKEDTRKHDEKQIIEVTENSKSLKQARQKQRLGKGQLISIMEENGTHIHDKDRIVKKCVELCEEQYILRIAVLPDGVVQPDVHKRCTISSFRLQVSHSRL